MNKKTKENIVSRIGDYHRLNQTGVNTTRQALILLCLNADPDLTVTKLAPCILTCRSATREALKRLEERDLVVVGKAPGETQKTKMTLTNKGKKAIKLILGKGNE